MLRQTKLGVNDACLVSTLRRLAQIAQHVGETVAASVLIKRTMQLVKQTAVHAHTLERIEHSQRRCDVCRAISAGVFHTCAPCGYDECNECVESRDAPSE